MSVIRIFISSPGDVGHERYAAAQVISRLGTELTGSIALEPYFWEHEPMHAGDDFQRQIPPLAAFDIFVCILWSRLGTRLHSQHTRQDGSRYRSGTEYEFETALTAFRQSGRKNPLILIYRRSGIPSFPAEPEDLQRERQEQWNALKHFFEHWFTDVEDGGTFKSAFKVYLHTAEFEEQLEEDLRKDIQTLIRRENLAPVPASATAVAAATWKGQSPYRGLEVFEFEHAPIFFGRTHAIDEVINQLRDRASEHQPCPFVLILGASGSGKSSLLRGGIIPTLVAGGVDGIGLWRRAVMRPSQAGPGHDLFDVLAAALVQPAAVPELAVRNPPEKLAALLRNGAEGIGLLLTGILPQIAETEYRAEKVRLGTLADEDERTDHLADAEHKRRLIGELRFPEPRLILAVDQLEEIFTYAKQFPPENRLRFIHALDSLARCGYVWVAATLRSDFFARCAEVPRLIALASGKGHFYLLPPNGTELGQMIRRPAQAAGVVFESDPVRGRLDDVLRDAAVHDPAALPLLEFTLDQLFTTGGADHVLTHADYDQLGGGAGAGLRGVFVRTADEIWKKLPVAAQSTFPAIFRRLATIDPAENGAADSIGGNTLRFARRSVPLPGDDAPEGEQAVVAALLEARLLVADADGAGRQFVSVAHEALLNEWPRIRKLLEKESAYLHRRARVSVAAAEWERERRSTERLAAGIDLAEAREVLAEERMNLTAVEASYVTLSISRNRRRIVQLAASAAGLVLVFAALAGWASLAARAASQRKHEVQGLLASSDFSRGQELFDAGDAPGGLVYLARAVELDPAGVGATAADRLWFALTQRGWPLPVSLPMKHRDGILSASFSPDGAKVITASRDNSARLWNARTGQPIGEPMQHRKLVRCAVFSPDGRRVLTGCFDGTVRLWDAATGEPVPGWQASHGDSVNSAAVSPHNRWAATGARDGTVRLWDLESGQQRATWTQPENVHTLAFHPSDDTILLTVSGVTLRVWHVPDGKPLMEFAHPQEINSARFSRDGTRIITACGDGQARVWKTGDAGQSPSAALQARQAGSDDEVTDAFFNLQGNLIATVAGTRARVWNADGSPLSEQGLEHHATITIARFSPDGARLITGGTDGRVQMWAARTGAPLGEPIREAGAITTADFGPDGKCVLAATATGAARVWHAASAHPNALALPLTGTVVALAASPDGHWLAVASGDGKAQVWDLTRNPPVLRSLPHPASVLCVAFSADSRSLATGAADTLARVWTVASLDGDPLKLPHTASVCALAFSPDGRRLATATESGIAQCWALPGGRPQGQPMTHTACITALAFSSDGRQILTASEDDTARLWEAGTGKPIGGPLPSENEITCAAFDPVGNIVATGSRDGRARLWNASDGKLHGEPLQHHGPVLALAFSPDGRRLATASDDHTAALWDPATNRSVCDALRHDAAVLALAFNPDGTRVATAAEDGTVRLWDTASGQAVSERMPHAGPVRSIVFSRDGRRLFSGTADRATRVWDVATSTGDSQRAPLTGLARALSPVRLQESGRLEPCLVPTEDALRRTWPGARAALATWFFADPAMRALTPFAAMTLPGYIKARIAEGTPVALDEAELWAQGDPAVMEQVAQARGRTPSP